MLIKEMINEEKPRERLIKYGEKNITNEDLISIILRTGTKNNSVKELSSQILLKVNAINNLKNISLNDLVSIKGLKNVKAITLIAAIELGRRVYEENSLKPKMQLNSSKIVYQTFAKIIDNSSQEHFLAIYLDTQKRLIDYKILFTGTVDYSLVHPRDIFKEAYRLSASAIIIMHNHPSGISSPSQDDIDLTKNLRNISKIMSIPIIDHLIIGKNEYYSFLEHNQID